MSEQTRIRYAYGQLRLVVVQLAHTPVCAHAVIKDAIGKLGFYGHFAQRVVVDTYRQALTPAPGIRVVFLALRITEHRVIVVVAPEQVQLLM